VRNIALVTGYPPANFGDTRTIGFRFMCHWANTVQTDHVTLWRNKFQVCRPCHSEDMAHDVPALMGLVTLTYDPETGMRVAR